MPPPIAFSHYSRRNDISGVTTWIERLLIRLREDDVPVSLLLHHSGVGLGDAPLVEPLVAAGVAVEIEKAPPYTEQGFARTIDFLNRHRPRAFFPQCLEPMIFAAGFAGSAGLPWALTIHADDPVYWAIADVTRPETTGGTIVAVSEHIAEQVRIFGLSRSPHIIPCGVSLVGRVTTFSDRPFRVVFSGRVVEEQKRFSLVIAAMALACQRDSRIEGLVLGDGDDLAVARSWVDASGLRERIRFAGRVDPSVVGTMLSECQAVLLMSDYEGLPVALLEAMAVGVVPVVREIQSGIPELVQHRSAGLLVDDTPEAAADAIVELASDPTAWARYSNAARSVVVDGYSEGAAYRKWRSLIDDMEARCTVQYPIVLPARVSLPPEHGVLADRDRRRPPLWRRPLALAQRSIRRARRLVTKACRLLAQRP